MKIAANTIISMLLLGACSQDAKVETEITRRFGESLKDPGSLQLRNIKQFPDGTTCGEYNSKNLTGGYAGFKKFIHNRNGIFLNTFVADQFLTTELLFESDTIDDISHAATIWCSDSTYAKKSLTSRKSIVAFYLIMYSEDRLKKTEDRCNSDKHALVRMRSETSKSRRTPGELELEQRLVDARCAQHTSDARIRTWALSQAKIVADESAK